MFRGRTFHEERTASVKTLSWDCALCVHWNIKGTSESGEGWGERVL